MTDPIALLAAEPDRTRRGLLLAALIGEAVGADAIVVGGFAVEAWSRGGYVTADLDLVCARRTRALDWLEGLGFVRRNRHVLHDRLGLAVEIPGTVLDQGRASYDHLARWRVGDREATVLSVEDTIVDRLAAEVHGAARGERENALRLMAGWWGALDLDWLEERARVEHVIDELNAARAWVAALRGRGPTS